MAARRVQPARLIKDYALDGTCTRIREQRIRWRDVRDGREPWPREAIAYLRERAAEYNRCALIGDGLLTPKRKVDGQWVDEPSREALTEVG